MFKKVVENKSYSLKIGSMGEFLFTVHRAPAMTATNGFKAEYLRG